MDKLSLKQIWHTLRNLANVGNGTVCHNFMSAFDWTRTILDAFVTNGRKANGFESTEYAAFDFVKLARKGDEASQGTKADATRWWKASIDEQQKELTKSFMSRFLGLCERIDVSGLEKWVSFTSDDLRATLSPLIEEAMPPAAELRMRLCVHLDVRPRHLFGLPRTFSNQDDLDYLAELVDHVSNGCTLCSGSLGADPNNEMPNIASIPAQRTHFAHLRNVIVEENGAFQESEHLDGDVEPPIVVASLVTRRLEEWQKVP